MKRQVGIAAALVFFSLAPAAWEDCTARITEAQAALRDAEGAVALLP